MILKIFIVGELEVNCYVLADDDTKEAIIIDPGAEPEAIKRCLAKNGLKPLFIVNTHGHADHIGANRFFDLPILIHELEKDFLTDSRKNLSAAFGFEVISPKASRLLNDGDRIKVGSLSLAVLHTPGHSPGGISLKVDDVLFTGDALFHEGIGRTDLPNSSGPQLLESIRNKILVLPDKTIVYPGHGPSSTIGHEKKNNPFL
ncbi:MAG: MBL fold metallo-hydrolase [Candidatus Omnitrophica bacterium CG07_land_8_20_14_0_80_42_15]|uniref:MBL fold metallo-hydrolase n=1 Tax=Candidatus Aquitaenariimonas noxiae TaxID=1974741 RepID=A0A2J0KUT4_9BACT|nr:MAG: MBL fold metallo-hydrolase [Candidatus Omnitrophica bacterium CG07_land_8_20_14_0_80_42_15]